MVKVLLLEQVTLIEYVESVVVLMEMFVAKEALPDFFSFVRQVVEVV